MCTVKIRRNLRLQKIVAIDVEDMVKWRSKISHLLINIFDLDLHYSDDCYAIYNLKGYII